ncbi:hypothetical protein FRC11_009608 [Ceratobasidium sp. 423]|nr:hypothetical protein FRC11_009608 [Ceratobasidium sp. 423]
MLRLTKQFCGNPSQVPTPQESQQGQHALHGVDAIPQGGGKSPPHWWCIWWLSQHVTRVGGRYTSESQTHSPSRTHTYNLHAPSCTQTYDSCSPLHMDRSPSCTEAYTDTHSRLPSHMQTYASRSASHTPTTSRSPLRAYSAYSNDDDQTYDDACTYDNDEAASAYNDGHSGSAFYDDGQSRTGSRVGTRYDDSRSNSQFTDEWMASRSASQSARTYDDDLSAHSGYNDTQTGYDDAQSTAYDDAQGSNYHLESQISDSQNYPASQGACSQSAHSQGAHSQGGLSQGQSKGQYSEDDGTSASSSINPQEILASLHSRMLNPISFERKVLSTVEEQTERTSSTMSKLSSNQFASRGRGGGSGSKVSLSPTCHSGPSRTSSEATSLFSPSTHGSYLSPSGPTQAPLKLFSPITPLQPLGKDKDCTTSLEWPGTSQSDYHSTAGSDHLSFLHPSLSEQNLNLKLKEKEEALARHPSAMLGRHAGDLIAFFESGGQKAASDAAKSVGSVSPSKLSIGLPVCMFASGSRSGSGSGSYTGSGSDVGGSSSAASPFACPCVGLGFETLFLPSFCSMSPFRPSSPTKSAASGTGSFVSGSHRSGARSQTYGGSQTYRSNGMSEAGWSSQTYCSDGGSEVKSKAYQSEGHESQTYHSEGGSQTYCSDRGSQMYCSSTSSQTYRSGTGSQTYRSDGGSETYRSDHKSDASLSVPPSETACSAGSETARSQTYCSDGGSDTYHTETATYQAPSEAPTARSMTEMYQSQSHSQSHPHSIASGTYTTGSKTYRSEGSYWSGSDMYQTHNSDTYCESESRTETPCPNMYTNTESETYCAGSGSEGGISGFASQLYPHELDAKTVTGRSPSSHGRSHSDSGFSQGWLEGVFSQGCSEGMYSQGCSQGMYSQGQSEGSYSQGHSKGAYNPSRSEAMLSQGHSEGSYSQGWSEGHYSQGHSEGGHTQGLATSSTYVCGTSTYQDSQAYTPTYTQSTTYVPGTKEYSEGSEAYTQEEAEMYTQGSCTPPPIPPKSPHTPCGACTPTTLKCAMTPVTPKTPNPTAEDKFADWQDRTPQAGDKTRMPYTVAVLLTPHMGTPKTIAGMMMPKTQVCSVISIWFQG